MEGRIKSVMCWKLEEVHVDLPNDGEGTNISGTEAYGHTWENNTFHTLDINCGPQSETMSSGILQYLKT